MDTHAINRDPALKHTPWGRVRVSQPHGRKVAFVECQHWATGQKVMLGVVDDGKRVVWDAFYGKRQWEAVAVIEAAEKHRIAEQKRLEAIDRDVSRDRKQAIDKFLSRSVDGRENLIAALQGRKR